MTHTVGMQKIYLNTKSKLSMVKTFKRQTDTHTDRQTDIHTDRHTQADATADITTPHSRSVKIDLSQFCSLCGAQVISV